MGGRVVGLTFCIKAIEGEVRRFHEVVAECVELVGGRVDLGRLGGWVGVWIMKVCLFGGDGGGGVGGRAGGWMGG